VKNQTETNHSDPRLWIVQFDCLILCQDVNEDDHASMNSEWSANPMQLTSAICIPGFGRPLMDNIGHRVNAFECHKAKLRFRRKS
jgi:hypothetical protein